MVKKALTFGILTAFLALLLAGMASASGYPQVYAPLTEIKDTTLFNATITDTISNITNVTFYVVTASGQTQACSNASDLPNYHNLSAWACSVDSKGLGLNDVTTYTINVSMYNGSRHINSTANVTAVAVDNTVPACSFPKAFVESKRAYKFDFWLKANVQNTSDDCQIKINNKVYNVSVNGSTGSEECHKIFKSADLPAGTYDIQVTVTDASDTANSTTCTVSYVTVGKEASAVRGAVIDAEESGEDFEGEGLNKGQKAVFAIGGLAVVAYLFRKKLGF